VGLGQRNTYEEGRVTDSIHLLHKKMFILCKRQKCAPQYALPIVDGRHGSNACWGYVLAAADTLMRVDKFMAISEDGQISLNAGRNKAVHLWDLHDYGFTKIIPAYEVFEALYLIHAGSSFASLMALFYEQSGKKTSGSFTIHFITIGEHGIE